MIQSSTTKKCKILFIEAGSGSGGSSKYLFYLLTHIDREKFEPIVAFYFKSDGPDIIRIKKLGVKTHFISNRTKPIYSSIRWMYGGMKGRREYTLGVFVRFSLRLLLKELPFCLSVLWVIKKEDIDLVVLNSVPDDHISSLLAVKLARVPCVCRWAGVVEGAGRKITKILTSWVDKFITISEATEVNQSKYFSQTNKVFRIYGGIDINRFSLSGDGNKIRKQFGIQDNEKIVGYVSRITEGKGHLEFIEAARMVLDEYSEVTFLIVGDEVEGSGKITAKLKERTASLGISDQVIFAGWRDDIPEILSALDIFVHYPTSPEGLGIANLEAMASGKPVIVSRAGGLSEAVVNGVTGIVLDPGDPCQLSKAILRLLKDEKLRATMGESAKRLTEEKFDIQKNVKKMEEVFLEALSKMKSKIEPRIKVSTNVK